MTDTLTTPRASLFDWDNTLVDTWPVIHEALNVTMRDMGAEEWSLERVKRDVKRSMRESFPELFGDDWEDAARIYQDAYRAVHLERLKPLPGSEATLQYIATKTDVFCGLVSNKRGPSLRTELKHLGWEPHVHVAVGAGDAAHDKPDIAPMLHALKDSGMMPGPDVWFVGDTTVDLECANAGNATSILYGPVTPDGHIYEGVPFAHHVVDQAALLQLLKQHLG